MLTKLSLVFMIRSCGTDLACLNNLWQPIATCVAVWLLVIGLSRWFWPTIYTRPKYVRVCEMTPWDRDGVIKKTELTPESFKVDNPYLMFAPPLWQVSIAAEIEGKMVLVGHASRVHNHLIANWHVLNVAPLDTLHIMVYRPGKEIHRVRADQLTWETLVEDIAYASLDKAKIHLPGVTNAKIAHVTNKVVAQIATDYPTANASNGLLERHPEVWGMLRYEGSTRNGFSGATYFAGKQMYGVHTYGGAENQGYSASYIATLLKKAESSDYLALRDMMRHSDEWDYRWKRSGNPDEISIEYQGRFFVIEIEEFDELQEEYPLEDYEGGRRRTRKRKSYASDYSSGQDYSEKSWSEPSEASYEDDREWENAPIEPTTMEVGTQTDDWDEWLADKKVRELIWDRWEEYPRLSGIETIPEVSDPTVEEDLLFFESAEVENCNAPRQAGGCLGGKGLEVPEGILCPQVVPPPVPCQNYSPVPTTTGPSAQPQQLEQALSCMINTLKELTISAARQTKQKSTGSRRRMRYATRSDTQHIASSSPKKKATGKQLSKASIGMPRQVSEPSAPIVRTRTFLNGTASGLAMLPTMSNSKHSSGSGYRPSAKRSSASAEIAQSAPPQ